MSQGNDASPARFRQQENGGRDFEREGGKRLKGFVTNRKGETGEKRKREVARWAPSRKSEIKMVISNLHNE